MSDELKPCPTCHREWPLDSEQSACIEIYKKCIVCMNGECDFDKIIEVQNTKYNTLPNDKEPKDYAGGW